MKKETINFILAGIIMLMVLNMCPKSLLAQSNKRYKVGVADIMILKRQKIGAFSLSKELGADGVEVDMGGLGNRETFDNKLAVDSIRMQFLAKSKELNIQISSLAMTGFYSQSFAQRPTAVKAVQDCINTAKLMNVKVIFLPFGVQGDLIKNPELRPAIVERLKAVGKIAEQAGLTIGIETSLSAKDELKLLKDVGSPAVKSYFNFANAVKNNRDIVKELETLGKNNIVQIHCTDDDGVWLQNDTKINLKEIKQTLDKMGWSGWLVIERSRDASDPKNVKKNFTANTTYVKSIFQQ